MFDKKITLFHQHAETKEQALEMLANRFIAAGVVKDTYLEGILKRESVFPTGLFTDTYGVAIPHADSDYVYENQLGVMTLDEPVDFNYMGNAGEIVPVRIIIMMAVQGHDQVDMLMKLMSIFAEPEVLQEIIDCNDYETFAEIAKRIGL
ncbi:MAG: PTS sugar transporter subunit IIA [Erysipelotrichaceae bacterium]|nr:PTS sugar transporter subunit IIA [Erysipelotrichaceae bacterium]